jgi:vesicle-fusing ATPase
MKDNIPNQKRAILLYGQAGNGKTSIALNYAKHSKFSYVKFITPDNFVGLSDNQKVMQLSKIFENAYKTANACIVVDCI